MLKRLKRGPVGKNKSLDQLIKTAKAMGADEEVESVEQFVTASTKAFRPHVPHARRAPKDKDGSNAMSPDETDGEVEVVPAVVKTEPVFNTTDEAIQFMAESCGQAVVFKSKSKPVAAAAKPTATPAAKPKKRPAPTSDTEAPKKLIKTETSCIVPGGTCTLVVTPALFRAFVGTIEACNDA